MGISSKTASSKLKDEFKAVADVCNKLSGPNLKAVMFFVSVDYDLPILGKAIEKTFSVPVFGCTTAGHIGPGGYHERGLQATAIYGDSISAQIEVIHPLEKCQAIACDLGKKINTIPLDSAERRFGVLFVDGLARMEERLTASLHHCLPDIAMIGGSAGDDLTFRATYVYANGKFLSNAAVLAIFETSTHFAAFKFHHFIPTDDMLVVTEANAETRTVIEFNGEPAAQRYAEYLGISVDELSPSVYSKHPVMMKVGDDYYLRSIQQCNDDMSITFYCAIATGIVLRLGIAVNPIETARVALMNIRQLVPSPELIISCDCVLRRLEFENTGLSEQIGELLTKNKVVGFSTYGEQFNALHMNQTFTGLAIGES
jgi:hypothetical protein